MTTYAIFAQNYINLHKVYLHEETPVVQQVTPGIADKKKPIYTNPLQGRNTIVQQETPGISKKMNT